MSPRLLGFDSKLVDGVWTKSRAGQRKAAPLRLAEIRDLAYRFVPPAAADERLYTYGPRSWWPAHEIGHFLVATKAECRRRMFGLDNLTKSTCTEAQYRYVIVREIAAITISQRLLCRAGHVAIAVEEIEYTDPDTLDCTYEPWCPRAVGNLLRRNRVLRLPTSFAHVETLLMRKAREVDTKFYASRRAAEGFAP